MHIIPKIKGMCSESPELFQFLEIRSDNILKMVQDRDIVAMED